MIDEILLVKQQHSRKFAALNFKYSQKTFGTTLKEEFFVEEGFAKL